MKSTIAFYNTENFFDINDNPEKFDNEYTIPGNRKWTLKRYQDKLWKISKVISRIGFVETRDLPLIVGLAEIENSKVLNDLVHSEHLSDFAYDFVHFESLDERGIDNALIYRKEFAKPISIKILRQTFERENGRTDYTRDALFVKFKLNQKELNVFVVHLPSRREKDVNLAFRNQIMQNLRIEIDEILAQDPFSQIILMGDFNCQADDPNAMKLLNTSGNQDFKNQELYNPMLNFNKNAGSLKHKGRWYLYDQMLFSKSFFENDDKKIQFESAHIYKDESIKDTGKGHKGWPYRTFAGTKYLGGYSDHFPVYAILNV